MGKVLPLFFAFAWCISFEVSAQKPTIISVDKESGPMNDIVTLKGNDFGTDRTKLKVFFGGVSADIKTVSNQLMEVKTPSGATYDNISVTNITNGLTGYSSAQYFLNFNGTHGLAAANFSPEVDFAAESGLYDLCLCDFNGDKKVDIGTASDNSSYFTILQNASTAGTITLSALKVLNNAKSLHTTCGDLNGDGKPDLVLSEGADGGHIFIFRNTGGFTFDTQNVNLVGKKVKRVAIADLDLNGKPEIVITDQGSNVITILPNQSTGSAITFGAPLTFTVPAAATTDALEIKDLNGNGLPEIVTSQFLTASSNIFICDNKSTPGAFNFSDVTKLTISGTIVNVRVGDLDNDKKPDLAVTRFLSSDVSVLLNQSTTTQMLFSAPASLITGSNPWGIDLGDLDGDGKLDIAVGSISVKSIAVFNNQSTPGNISFTSMLSLPTTYINRHIKIGDIDGDGKPDITYTSIDDNNKSGGAASLISVFRNKSCFVPTLSPKGPLSVCSGFALKLLSSEGGGVTYNWSKDGTGVLSGPAPTLDVSASGSYTVTVLSESGTCSKVSNAVSVTVAAPGAGLNSTVPNARSNSPVCTKDVLNLQVDNVAATQYRWSGPNGFTASSASPTATLSNFSLDNAGLYIVEMMAGSCIAKTDSTRVQGVSNPDFTVSFSGAAVVCQGSTKTLSISPVVTSGFTFQWFEKTLGSLPGETNSTLAATKSGDYSVKVTSSFAGCSPSQTPEVKVTKVMPPTAAFTPSVTAGCVGQIITFTNQSTVDTQLTPTYDWTFGDGQVSSLPSPTNTYAQAGTFQVKLIVTYSGGSCPDQIIKPITVINAPAVNITTLNNKSKLCSGDTLRLKVSGAAFTSYLWSTGETTPSIVVNEAKEYTVTVTNAGGCIFEKKKVIDGLPSPTVTASATPPEIKADEASTLTATGLSSYNWSPNTFLSDVTIASPVAKPSSTIIYTVSGVGANGCKGEATVKVTVQGTSILDLIVPKNYFSPNDDQFNPYWTIENIQNFPQCTVLVYNDKGAKVFEAKPYTENWDGTFKGSRLPEGVYYYVIRCDDEARMKTGSITLLK